MFTGSMIDELMVSVEVAEKRASRPGRKQPESAPVGATYIYEFHSNELNRHELDCGDVVGVA